MSKYKNKKTVIDNITFMSQREGMRYLQLKDRERNGSIKDLKLQVPFILQPSFKLDGKTIREIKYIADFTYMEKRQGDIPSWKEVVEDCKGFKTDIYRMKKKLFEYKYQTTIRET